jgi:hypothetical protein
MTDFALRENPPGLVRMLSLGGGEVVLVTRLAYRVLVPSLSVFGVGKST